MTIIKRYKNAFLLFLLILNYNSKAQVSVHDLREANKQTKIAIKDIIGDWYAGDSLKTKIRFVTIGNYYVSIEGIKHGVGDYGFIIDKDSLSVNGTAPNWPPYDCTLRLLSKNTLEIKFYQFFSTDAYPILYKRE